MMKENLMLMEQNALLIAFLKSNKSNHNLKAAE